MLDRRVNDTVPGVPYAGRMETIGDRIKRRRLEQGMTQLQLAQIAGVTKGAVSQWELGGTKNLKLEVFLKVCEALHTTPEYLVSGTTSAGATGRSKAARVP